MSDENLFGDPDLPDVWQAASTTKRKGRKRAERAKDKTEEPSGASMPPPVQAATKVHKEGDDMSTEPKSEPKREKKRPTFEETYKKLEKIIADLERDDIPLDELLCKFQEGVGYVRECTKFINDARLRIEQFVEQKDGSWVIKNLEQ